MNSSFIEGRSECVFMNVEREMFFETVARDIARARVLEDLAGDLFSVEMHLHTSPILSTLRAIW